MRIHIFLFFGLISFAAADLFGTAEDEITANIENQRKALALRTYDMESVCWCPPKLENAAGSLQAMFSDIFLKEFSRKKFTALMGERVTGFYRANKVNIHVVNAGLRELAGCSDIKIIGLTRVLNNVLISLDGKKRGGFLRRKRRHSAKVIIQLSSQEYP